MDMRIKFILFVFSTLALGSHSAERLGNPDTPHIICPKPVYPQEIVDIRAMEESADKQFRESQKANQTASYEETCQPEPLFLIKLNTVTYQTAKGTIYYYQTPLFTDRFGNLFNLTTFDGAGLYCLNPRTGWFEFPVYGAKFT
jgi:hypothetical protein